MPWRRPVRPATQRRIGGVLEGRFHPACPGEIGERLSASEGSKPQLANWTFSVATAARIANRDDGLGFDLRSGCGVLQSLRLGLAATLERPRGQERRSHTGAGRRIGVLIARDIDTTGARLIDEAQGLSRPAPVRLADHLVMGHLRGQSGAFSDGDRLADAVEYADDSSR